MIFAGIALVVCGLCLIVFAVLVLYAEEDREWTEKLYPPYSPLRSSQSASGSSSSCRGLNPYESTVEIVVLDERRDRT